MREVDFPASAGRYVQRSTIGQYDVNATGSRSDVIDLQVRAQVVDQRLPTQWVRQRTRTIRAFFQFCAQTKRSISMTIFQSKLGARLLLLFRFPEPKPVAPVGKVKIQILPV